MLTGAFVFLLAITSPAPDLAHNADARACFARLLALGGYGRRPDERAAFLVREDDGRYACVIWPATNGWQSSQWRGPRPEHTAAVVHTHPRNLPHPSLQDAQEAQRLQLPIIVVTPDRISLIRNPDDATEILASAPGWWR